MFTSAELSPIRISVCLPTIDIDAIYHLLECGLLVLAVKHGGNMEKELYIAKC